MEMLFELTGLTVHYFIIIMFIIIRPLRTKISHQIYCIRLMYILSGVINKIISFRGFF